MKSPNPVNVYSALWLSNSKSKWCGSSHTQKKSKCQFHWGHSIEQFWENEVAMMLTFIHEREAPGRIRPRSTKRRLHWFKNQLLPWLSPSMCRTLKPKHPFAEKPMRLMASAVGPGNFCPIKKSQRSTHPSNITNTKSVCSNNGTWQLEAHRRPSGAL